MMATTAADRAMRDAVLARLGQHYEFQAAQRIAMNSVFKASEREPTELLAIAWDKMDQNKTIVPRVVALSSTQFMKNSARLVVSLIGVLIPALTPQPIFYTVLEDHKHGSNMIGSLLLDILLHTVHQTGTLPRRLFIQADNTAKETKNTITIFIALWLLAQLEHTRLEAIEFGYLLVGHTHDLIDTTFSYVNRALRQTDFLSLPEMFAILRSSMRNPPIWRHIRDMYDFHSEQPAFLSAQYVRGTRQPHHYKLYRDRSGSLCVQSKRWLTSSEWTPPVVLCNKEQAAALRAISPASLAPTWEKGFETQAKNFFVKLRNLLQTAGRDVAGIQHSLGMLRHELKEYLPTATTLDMKMTAIRVISARKPMKPQAALTSTATLALQEATSAAFPGAASHVAEDKKPLIFKARDDGSANVGFRSEPIEEGMMVIFQNSSDDLPFRVGQILRVAREHSDPYAIMQTYWHISKPDKFGSKLNAFGTWVPAVAPVSLQSCQSKRQRTTATRVLQQSTVTNQEVVSLSSVLVWPIMLEKGAVSKNGGRIPFAVFHYLRAQCGIDMSQKKFVFSERAQSFVDEVRKIVAGLIAPPV
jgi:hypothetical protein